MEITSDIDIKILERLREWELREGQLPSYVKLQCELLHIQSEVKSRVIVTKPGLTKSSMSERLRNGVPLLAFEDFSPDWDEVRRVFEQIILWAVKDSEYPSEEMESLKNITRNGSLIRKIAKDWYQAHSLTPIARARNIDVGLLNSVAGAVLKPFMLAYSRLLLPEVDQELWRRSYCPICGGMPDFAFLDKPHGARWLACCRCDCEWLFQRLECPYCSNQNQNTLSYFTDDNGLYRLYVCEQCKQYLKTIDLRQAKEETWIPLERLFTIGMDVKAGEYGYGARPL